jgi:hypothetical protein
MYDLIVHELRASFVSQLSRSFRRPRRTDGTAGRRAHRTTATPRSDASASLAFVADVAVTFFCLLAFSFPARSAPMPVVMLRPWHCSIALMYLFAVAREGNA